MRKFSFLFLFVGLLMAIQGWAAPLDQAKAERKAKSYLANELYAGRIMAPAALNPVLLKAESCNEKQAQPVYYIFNTSTTFLVIAGDDRAEEILMVGDRPLEDINNLPLGMQDMLNIYKEEIKFLFDHPDLKVDSRLQPAPSFQAVSYGPLLTALWDQGAPYNKLCQFYINGNSYQCTTGCPATAASMVLYYYKYPASVGEQAAYDAYFKLNNVVYSCTYPTLPATTFSWSNMKDIYTTSYTEAQANAVAKLMRYAGHAMHTSYGTNGSSGVPVGAESDIVTMFKKFGYCSTTRLVKKSSYSNADDWANLIIDELAANRPVVYLAGDENNDSIHHVFTVDGYRGSDSRFHMNYGGGGDGNNWAKMNSFTYAGYTFSKNQKAIIGIQPPPSLSVSSTSLSFSGITGKTYTKSFTVTGKYLTGNLTISKSGSAVYSVSPTSLTPAQVAAGATVKVTYKPTAAGTQTGKITISGGGASTKTVSLTGTATKPTVTVSPTSLTFSSITVGKSATKQFSVNGNLTGSITLKVNGTGFTINKTTITPTEAKEGAIITVTYKPTAAGTHTGSITLSGGGVSNKTVTLKGTAVNRTITTSPTSLRITSAKPFSASKTFTVKGTNLNSSVMLRVSNGVFTLDKTTLTAAQANAGATVKVTFTPTSLGTFTGKVTISGGNAASTATVTLTGVCNVEAAIMSPTITPSMLIDGLLNNDVEVLKNPDADVNGDGRVDINDVRALINLQLVEIVEAE